MGGALNAAPKAGWALAAHGGAGAITREALTWAQDAAYRAALHRALLTGAAVLSQGGRAIDAVEATVAVMEDDPLFNAGRGAAFTAEGRNELDASIMDGKTLQAGAVTGVTRTRHPVSLARRVMEHSSHVMLSAPGADAFSLSEGLEQAEPHWFYTRPRWHSLESLLESLGLPLPERPANVRAADSDPAEDFVHDEGKMGTVGAVACDLYGDVAAATSTGGTRGKRWGRIGDSPIIGAGTYASNTSCAVSGTGAGEYFIRLALAREVCALIEHRSMSLQAAVDEAIHVRLARLGGDGGVIAVAPDGRIAWSFNTAGMHRARLAQDGSLVVSLYRDEP